MEHRDDQLIVDTDHQDERIVVTITGMLDLRAVDQLRTQLAALVNDDVRLVIDLGAVEFLDSSGLRALLSARQDVVDRGGSMALRGQSERVQRILEVTGVQNLFPEG